MWERQITTETPHDTRDGSLCVWMQRLGVDGYEDEWMINSGPQ